MIKQLENVLYISILGLVGLFGLSLQDSLVDDPQEIRDFNSRHDPDYYIENFTATGLDKNGDRKFVIEAERMCTLSR